MLEATSDRRTRVCSWLAEEARGPMAPSDMACTPAITGNAGEVSAPDGVNPNVEQAMFDTTVAPDFSPGTHAAVPTAAQPPPEGKQADDHTAGIRQY